MKTYSSRAAAKKLGISLISMQRYIVAKKIRAPKLQRVGGVVVRLWSAADLRRVRVALPKVRDGRRSKKRRK